MRFVEAASLDEQELAELRHDLDGLWYPKTPSYFAVCYFLHLTVPVRVGERELVRRKPQTLSHVGNRHCR